MVNIPECFVFDQDGGADWVSQRLKESWHLTSLDLKSATDNIPLSNQLALMRQLLPDYLEELEMFSDISRMSWTTPHPFFVRWEVGHPMGVNASFPLFTTWLVDLFYQVGAAGRFCIVGDDLVFDSSYESEVLARLGVLNVPVNRGKSLFSDRFFAEFVGRIIDSVGSLDVFKASPFSYSDPLGLIRQYGKSAIEFLGPVRLFGTNSYKEVVEVVSYYTDSEVLRTAVLEYASPYDRLNAEGQIPDPVYSGGVTSVIIHKMLDSATVPPLTAGNLSYLERIYNFPPVGWDDIIGVSGLYLSFLRGVRKLVLNYSGNHAYSVLIARSRTPIVKAFTVAVNDPLAVRNYNRLIASLKECVKMEEAFILLDNYEAQNELFNLHPIVARNIAKTELAARARVILKDDKSLPTHMRRRHSSYVSYVFRLIKRAAKRFTSEQKTS
jgi:hypothetical protein